MRKDPCEFLSAQKSILDPCKRVLSVQGKNIKAKGSNTCLKWKVRSIGKSGFRFKIQISDF